MGMLDVGVTVMGAAKRVFDKYGKRMFVATPVMNTSNKHQVNAAPRKAA
jgi:hypothetical protein